MWTHRIHVENQFLRTPQDTSNIIYIRWSICMEFCKTPQFLFWKESGNRMNETVVKLRSTLARAQLSAEIVTSHDQRVVKCAHCACRGATLRRSFASVVHTCGEMRIALARAMLCGDLSATCWKTSEIFLWGWLRQDSIKRPWTSSNIVLGNRHPTPLRDVWRPVQGAEQIAEDLPFLLRA